MSCGLTNETVVHHGSLPPSWANQSSNWRAMRGVDPEALAGAAVGRGVGAAREVVVLEQRPALCRRPLAVVVGEVPLAVPPGVVAVIAQHRPPGRKARIERAAARDHAAGLVGVEAGQHRRARGRAVVRGRVVAAEGDRPFAQALEVRRQAHAAPRERAEPLREAQLVDHDHEDVRPPHGRGARRDAVRRLGDGRRARPRLRPIAGCAATGERRARARASEQAAGDRALLEEGAPVGLAIWFHACGAR